MAIENQYDSQHFLIESVNIILETLGEPPIETLEDVSNVYEAQLAEQAIIEAKRNVLSYGWDINTDTNFPLNPDSEGYINVPPHILDLNVSGQNIIVRDWKLYDKDEQSRKFDSPVLCDIKWNLDFNSLTHPFRYYITIMAARKLQARLISDVNMHSFTQQDEQQALLACKKSNEYTAEYNILSSSYGNNFTVLG